MNILELNALIGDKRIAWNRPSDPCLHVRHSGDRWPRAWLACRVQAARSAGKPATGTSPFPEPTALSELDPAPRGGHAPRPPDRRGARHGGEPTGGQQSSTNEPCRRLQSPSLTMLLVTAAVSPRLLSDLSTLKSVSSPLIRSPSPTDRTQPQRLLPVPPSHPRRGPPPPSSAPPSPDRRLTLEPPACGAFGS